MRPKCLYLPTVRTVSSWHQDWLFSEFSGQNPGLGVCMASTWLTECSPSTWQILLRMTLLFAPPSLTHVIILPLDVFSGSDYWFVLWFLFDNSGLLHTERQSQDLNRNDFIDLSQLTRDKLTPQNNLPSLPSTYPNKGKKHTATLSFFFDVLYKENPLEKQP